MAKFLTDTGTVITKRVKKGLTKVFTQDEREEAKAYAKRKGSYIYDLYEEIREKGGRTRVVSFGYAVPN